MVLKALLDIWTGSVHRRRRLEDDSCDSCCDVVVRASASAVATQQPEIYGRTRMTGTVQEWNDD
jgi:hypothetical protein